MKGFKITVKCEKCGQEIDFQKPSGKMYIWDTSDEGLVIHCNNCGNKSDIEDNED